MNTDEARELLGLASTSSFDQAMKARDKRMERYKDDPEKSMQVCHCRVVTPLRACFHHQCICNMLIAVCLC
jgi:hypothetical protein